jgi:hypothetical protein
MAWYRRYIYLQDEPLLLTHCAHANCLQFEHSGNGLMSQRAGQFRSFTTPPSQNPCPSPVGGFILTGALITVKPDVLLQASNIAILSHNIAILIGRFLRAIFNQHEQIASWNSQKFCKQSLWLDYKKGRSTNTVAQTIWLASLFLIIQSEALFTNLLWISNLQSVHVGCNFLRAICLSKLQYCGKILQCCSQENIRFDCKEVSVPHM